MLHYLFKYVGFLIKFLIISNDVFVLGGNFQNMCSTVFSIEIYETVYAYHYYLSSHLGKFRKKGTFLLKFILILFFFEKIMNIFVEKNK
jgi:hypothetical protein